MLLATLIDSMHSVAVILLLTSVTNTSGGGLMHLCELCVTPADDGCFCFPLILI